MSRRQLFYASKKFLNKDGYHSDASIFTEISFHDKDSQWMDCVLKITDCNSRVHLTIELDADDGEERVNNTFYKLDTLISELVAFEKECLKAHKESKERARVQKEKEEQEKQTKEKAKDEVDFRYSNDFTVQHISNPAGDPPMGSGNLRQ